MTAAVTRPARGRAGERGIALLMVLWIFMVLTVLVGEFNRAMRNDAEATRNMAEEVQARGVAVAGINQAIYRSLRAIERHDAPERRDPDAEPDPFEPWIADGRWYTGSYWAGTYAVRLVDEGGKIGLNRADQALLRHVFERLGLEADAQEEVVDSILDWRDRDTEHRLHGAEAEYYLGLVEPYRPKDGPFDSVDELLLVRGITRDLFAGVPPAGRRRGGVEGVPLRDVFSVFNRSANINVRTAPAAVLRVLLEGDEEDVEDAIAARDEDPNGALTLLRARAGNPVLARRFVDRPPGTLTIEARGTMTNGHVEARVGAVVDVGEDADGFMVERWYDRLPAL